MSRRLHDIHKHKNAEESLLMCVIEAATNDIENGEGAADARVFFGSLWFVFIADYLELSEDFRDRLVYFDQGG